MSKLTKEQYDQIKQKAESYKKDMCRFLREIVKYPGESCKEKEHIQVIYNEMKKVGFDEVKIDKQGNVLGFMGTGSRIFAFDAHIDNVGIGNISNWKFDPYEGYENDIEIGGRGTSDQLGGIVSAVYGAKIMKDLNLIPKDVKILVTGTVQEEDCDGLCWQYIIKEDKIVPEFVVSTEPTDGGIYRGHRGRMEIKVYVKGISCHGSAPERGENAIYKMTDILDEVRALNENGVDDEIKGLVKMLDKRYNKEYEAANFLGKGTITVSQIGYTSPSRCAVADGCWCSLDRRMTAGETYDYCLDEVRNLPSCKKYAKDVVVSMYDYDSPSYTELVYPIECYFPTWWTNPDDPLCVSLMEAYQNLFHTDKRIGPDCQLEMRQKRPLLDKWTFSTNGVTIKGRNGVDCIGFGPGAEAQAHAPNERTWKCDLVTCASMYAAIPITHVSNVPQAKNTKLKGPLRALNIDFDTLVKELSSLNIQNMFGGNYFLTWDKTYDEIKAIWKTADAIRALREKNISCKVFDSGLGISLFRDNSTRTRFSFVSACNLLGLEVQDFDEGKSQIAHGETVRETSNMISFMADVIGIRDDMYIGKGHTYQKNVIDAVSEGKKSRILEQKPLLINLQCDIDHPTQVMADALHCIHEFGGLEKLKGKKIAMTWAYSPSYGKPLSVPQGVIGLFTRLGMDVSLAYPEGYEVMPEVIELAKKQAKESGGKFTITNNMKEAFKDADIVYPKSWAPFKAMEKRTVLYENGDTLGIKNLEKELLAQNATHKDWACTEDMMKLTKDGKALYLHCLPADISGVSCEMGEVDGSVFDRYRDPLYKQASYKPYIIAAMIFLSKFKDPVALLNHLKNAKTTRVHH